MQREFGQFYSPISEFRLKQPRHRAETGLPPPQDDLMRSCSQERLTRYERICFFEQSGRFWRHGNRVEIDLGFYQPGLVGT